jgi:hypothetical protein
LEKAVTSKKRDEILSSIIDSYCIVLFVHGKDEHQNKNAEVSVNKAIEKLSKIISQMPESIKKPPYLIEISQEMLSEEKILLWGLGLNPDQREEPAVALLYGKGRRIGPLMEGEEITSDRIFNLLSVIGASCECGIDRSWMLGTMIPLRWDEKTQSKVVETLGFDAESPSVKMEISQILSLGASNNNAVGSGVGEYSEKAIEIDSLESISTVSPAQLSQLVSKTSDDSSSKNIYSRYRITFLTIGGLILLVLAGSAIILLRARGRI